MYSHILDLVDEIDLSLIRKSRILSLRSDVLEVEDLMESIREKGLLQPIIVRHVSEGFEVVAGHRRYEACKRLRLRKIPACVVELNDKEAFELALTENIQRKSLNPIEEAQAFAKYVQEYGWGGVSDLAKRVGKSQEYVSQRVLLLTLPENVKRKIITRQLRASTARELVWIKDRGEQQKIAELVLEQNLSSRETRELVKAARDVTSLAQPKHDEVDHYAPDFQRYGLVKEVVNPSEKMLVKTIMVLRICLTRLDAIINSVNESARELRTFLMEQRLTVHKLIDAAIKMKVGLKCRALPHQLQRLTTPTLDRASEGSESPTFTRSLVSEPFQRPNDN